MEYLLIILYFEGFGEGNTFSENSAALCWTRDTHKSAPDLINPLITYITCKKLVKNVDIYIVFNFIIRYSYFFKAIFAGRLKVSSDKYLFSSLKQNISTSRGKY